MQTRQADLNSNLHPVVLRRLIQGVFIIKHGVAKWEMLTLGKCSQ